MGTRSNFERRKNRRISTPNGLWVSWQIHDRRTISRVQDLSVSGAFIISEDNVPVDTTLKLLFSVPEGEIQVQAVVRSFLENKGMGVEFVDMGSKEFNLILRLVKRLLG